MYKGLSFNHMDTPYVGHKGLTSNHVDTQCIGHEGLTSNHMDTQCIGHEGLTSNHVDTPLPVPSARVLYPQPAVPSLGSARPAGSTRGLRTAEGRSKP